MKVKIKNFELVERPAYIARMKQYIGSIGNITYETLYYSLDDDVVIRVDFEDGCGFWFESKDLEEVKENGKMKMRIKYFEGATKLEKITKGNWIDVYASKDVFVKENDRAMVPLGFALELPQGWEGHLAPRSSTFKSWGVIQTNHVGVVDDSYIGDNDQWHMPVYCLQGKDVITEEVYEDFTKHTKGTWIRKGDKIGQFRIMEVMPEIEFEEVEMFGNADRGSFGTTGKTKLNK